MGACFATAKPDIREDEIPETDLRTEEQKKDQLITQEPVSMTKVATGCARFSGYFVEGSTKTPILCSEGVLKKNDEGVYVSLPIKSKQWNFTIKPSGNLIGNHKLHAVVVLQDGTTLRSNAEVEIAAMDDLRIIEDVTFRLISENDSSHDQQRPPPSESSTASSTSSSKPSESEGGRGGGRDDGGASGDAGVAVGGNGEDGEGGDGGGVKREKTDTLEIQGSISWKIASQEAELPNVGSDHESDQENNEDGNHEEEAQSDGGSDA